MNFSFVPCLIHNKKQNSARYKRILIIFAIRNEFDNAMIIGRKREQQELLKAYESEYSEFVAVTGRRRVGKTFLVRETFDYKFAFQHSGLANQNTRAQLREFRLSLIRCGMKKCRIPVD